MDFNIMQGVYEEEKDSLNRWYWSFANRITICFSNNSDLPQSKCFEFKAIPPLGESERIFQVRYKGTIDNCVAPCNYSRVIFLEAGCSEYMEVDIAGSVVGVNSDDTRLFTMMLQNVKLCEIPKTPKNLRSVQLVEIDLLKKVNEICEKHNLHCYLFYGSLLGCVRNEMMVSWDDDIDIVLLRSEYNRLVQILQEELIYPYYLQTPNNTEDTFFGAYCRLRNLSTTGAVIKKNMERISGQGIWIDIFPLDAFDTDSERRGKQLRKISRIQNKLIWMSRLSRQSNRNILLSKLNEALREAEKVETEYVAILARVINKNKQCFYSKGVFDGSKRMQFEGIEVYVPSEYNKCLSSDYGMNYQMIPGEKERVPHHKAVFRTNESWDVFLARLNISKEVIKSKIILIGSGQELDLFLKKYPQSKITFIINDNLAGKLLYDIMVLDSDDLLSAIDSTSKIVICDKNYIFISQRLHELGIDEYFIFVSCSVMQEAEMEYLLSDEMGI